MITSSHKRTKRLLIAGIACLALFSALMAARLGLLDRFFPGAGRAPGMSENAIALPEHDTWMNIYQKESKIGYAHSTLTTEQHFYRLDEQMRMHFNLMGFAQVLKMRTQAQLNGDYTFSSFDFTLESGAFAFSASGSISETLLLTVTADIGGITKTYDIQLEKPMYLSSSVIYAAVRRHRLAPGNRFQFEVFDPSTMGQSPVTVEFLGTETINVMGNPYSASKLSLEFKGTRQTAWISEDGEVLKEEGLLGMTLEKTDRQTALAGIDASLAPDMLALSGIDTDTDIPHPERVSHLIVEISGASPEGFSLDGGRQELSGNTVTVTREAIEKIPEITGITDPERFSETLAAGPFIQSDDPRIRELAQKITARDASLLENARRIVFWIYDNIDKVPVVSVPDALSTLEHRKGDCNEHAVLVAALARAAGIPADIESGIAYVNGRFFYHAWNRLYVGKWITADAALGQMPADATHIRFVVGPTEKQTELMRLIDNLKISVKHMESSTGEAR